METKRLDYVDEMKGFAILLVCMGHLLGRHSSLGNLQPTLAIISSFHMGFFFFLSGYINEKTNAIEKNGVFAYVKKKAYSLLVPHFFWVFIAPVFLYSYYPESFNEFICKLNFYPNVNEWFLPCLFLAMMIWSVFNRIGLLTKLGGAIIAPIILVVLGIVFYQYFFLIYAIYMTCFLLGDYLSRSNSFKLYVSKQWVWGLSAILLCVVWKLYIPQAGHGGIRTILNLILYAISSLVSCIFFYIFFRKDSQFSLIKEVLCYWGRKSLVIYLTPIYLLPKGFLFPDNWTLSMTVITVIALGVLQCYVSSAFGELIFRVPCLKFLMYGKTDKRKDKE